MRFTSLRLPLQAAAIITVTATAFGVQAQNYPDNKAATPTDSTAAVFKRIDANQDGKISREEAARMPALAEKFDQIDKDKDGQLSAEEFAAGMEPQK